MARVILDTGVLIKIGRRQLDPGIVAASDDVALPAIALAEYLCGLELDPDAERRQRGRNALDQLLQLAVIEDYTAHVASHHAGLLAHVRRIGRPRSAHDLIIAATARATGRTLLTTNAKAGFDELPDVAVRVLE